MKFRYELIVGILIIGSIIFIITTYGTCHCKKKRSTCKKHMEGFTDNPDEEEEETTTLNSGIPQMEPLDNRKRTQFVVDNKNTNFNNNRPRISINNASCTECKSIRNNKTGKNELRCICAEPFNTSLGNNMESFDNLSTNFNNITFSNPNSSDSMLDFFKNIMFSTECCPSSYSNDRGCACISPSQYNVLRTRGTNNIPYSDL